MGNYRKTVWTSKLREQELISVYYKAHDKLDQPAKKVTNKTVENGGEKLPECRFNTNCSQNVERFVVDCDVLRLSTYPNNLHDKKIHR